LRKAFGLRNPTILIFAPSPNCSTDLIGTPSTRVRSPSSLRNSFKYLHGSALGPTKRSAHYVLGCSKDKGGSQTISTHRFLMNYLRSSKAEINPMNSDMNEYISVPIPKAACLVLFELLTSSYEEWRKLNPDDSSASPMQVTAEDHAQRAAFWKLEGALERTLLLTTSYWRSRNAFSMPQPAKNPASGVAAGTRPLTAPSPATSRYATAGSPPRLPAYPRLQSFRRLRRPRAPCRSPSPHS